MKLASTSGSTAEFMISIYSVKLTVQFPCRLSLHQGGKPITTQVEAASNIFTFNQDVTIKNSSKENVQISAYLSTKKGSSILAGLISLEVENLASKQGSRFTTSLQKCLDSQATIDMKVNHVWLPQEKINTNTKSFAGGVFVRPSSPEVKRRMKTHFDQTRSEYHAVTPKRGAAFLANNNNGSPQQLKQFELKRFNQKQSPVAQKFSLKFEGDPFEDDIRETRTVGGGNVSRYRREKDKQRMQKLAAKKITDETQNNLKLDIMKYKMKAQQMQKSVNEKNKTIKDLKEQILEHQRKNIEKSYIQEELVSKENAIRVLDERLQNLNSENVTLRQNIADNLRIISELKENIRFDILKNKEEYMRKEENLRSQLNQCQNLISELQSENSSKQNQIMKAKKYIQDLQSAAENKIFDHDRMLQQLKKQNALMIKQLNKRISEYEQRIQEMLKDISSKNLTISQLKQSCLRYEQNERIFEEKVQTLEMQKNQLLIYKVDFQNLNKKLAITEQNYKEEQKNSKKILQLKVKQFNDYQQLNNKNVKSLELKIETLLEKIKQSKAKIQQLENTLSMSKQEEEKLRKIIEKQEKGNQQLQKKWQQAEKQVKLGQSKIGKLEKELNEKSSNNNHMQSLYKIELQHSKESIKTLTAEMEELSFKFQKMKQSNEQLKSEKMKSQNKIQLQQQNIMRLTQYSKEKKQESDAKQNQFREQIRVHLNKIKGLEDLEKNKQKQINSLQIKDINNKNKIDKLEKLLEEANNKIDKLQNVTISKLNEDRNKLKDELESIKLKYQQVSEENKFITNERLKFESQSNKSTKINSVLNQEKISIVNQLNRAKNLIQRHEKTEEKLSSQLKSSQEQNKKLTLRIQGLQREYLKNKDILGDTMNSIMYLKKNMKQSLNIADIPVKDSMIGRIKTPNNQKKQSYNDNLTRSRVVSGYSNPMTNQQIDIKRITQILQSTSKEQQNTIIVLQESINHYKQTIEKLEKQLGTLSFTSQANQNKLQQMIDSLNNQLEKSENKIIDITNNYEDRISKLETEINKKDKDIKIKNSNNSSLKYELETLKKKFDIMLQDNSVKEQKYEEKIKDLANECAFYQGTLKNVESEKKEVQDNLYELEEQFNIEKEQKSKRERQIMQMNQKYATLRVEYEELLKLKKQNLQQLLTLKQENEALKQNGIKLSQLLKSQQKNNKKLQDFINELIKQKQNIVKLQLQSSSKVIQLESVILQMKNTIENREEQSKQKEDQIVGNKNSIKSLQLQIKNLENEIKQTTNKINSLNLKLEEKEKKIVEKQSEIKELKLYHTNILTKSKQQTKIAKDQCSNLSSKLVNLQSEKQNIVFSFEKKVIQMEQNIQLLNTQVIAKQELLFFEKQKSALNQSAINDLKKGQSEISLLLNKYEQQIQQLREQLTTKEEMLYDYSGKIYQLQQRLQAKDAQMVARQEKVDVDWQCRHDEICEQYEQKIEVLQKQKKYIKQKYENSEQQKAKLIVEREKYAQQFEKDIGSSKTKQKMLEQEKLQQMNQKNKEIDTLKNEVNLLKSQVKNFMIEIKKKQNQVANKDQAIKKLQVRIHENDRGSGSIKKQYEQEITNLKKNENAIKSLKEEIKNAQWVTEREVKKITQTFIQKVVNCFPEGKEKLVQPIRSLETSMAAVINFKV